MISEKNVEIAKKLIKNEKKPIIVKAQNDEFNRKMLEYGHFDVLLSIESGERKRGVRQIDSGFNHVLASLAKKNKITIGIDIKEISGLNKEMKGIRLSRIIQNIKLCKKSGTKLVAMNYKDKRDIFSLLVSLGASTKQAKEAISF